jgi:hypothetical protein
VGSCKWCACLASPNRHTYLGFVVHLCGEQRLLGSGGHAKVYEAMLGSQQVALKVVDATDPAARHEVSVVSEGCVFCLFFRLGFVFGVGGSCRCAGVGLGSWCPQAYASVTQLQHGAPPASSPSLAHHVPSLCVARVRACARMFVQQGIHPFAFVYIPLPLCADGSPGGAPTQQRAAMRGAPVPRRPQHPVPAPGAVHGR